MRETGHPLLAKGAYLLRTNCTETDPAKLWRWYIQLTQAEAALRTAKSDPGLRPICHQRTDRVEAHLLICFLRLALWRSLEMWMQSKSLGSSARKVVAAFSTIRSMDVTVPVKRAEHVLTLRLRTVAKPGADVALLLARRPARRAGHSVPRPGPPGRLRRGGRPVPAALRPAFDGRRRGGFARGVTVRRSGRFAPPLPDGAARG